jgi:hypothetical protein
MKKQGRTAPRLSTTAENSGALQCTAGNGARPCSALEQFFHSHAADFRSGFIAESPAKMRRLLQYSRALHGLAPFPAVHCNAPEFSAVVESRGAVRPCFFIPGPAAAGHDPSLPEAVNSPGMRELRHAIRDGRREECGRCVCSMWRDPAQIAQGFQA